MSTEQSFRPRIMNPDDQFELVRTCDSYGNYRDLHELFFRSNRDYLKQLYEAIPTQELPGDYFRLLGLTAILFSQYGFPSLDGQLGRHADTGGELSVFHQWHQLALIVYAAKINQQIYPLRKRLEKQLPRDKAVTVWGLALPVSKGTVQPGYGLNQGILELFASVRLEKKQPICLPTVRLNRQLSQLNFSGYDAERMSQKEFSDRVYPHARKIIDDLFDPQILNKDLF